MTTGRRRLRPGRWSGPVLVAALAIGALAVLVTAAARPTHPFPQPPVKTRTVAPTSVSPTNQQTGRTRHKSDTDSGGGLAVVIVGIVLALLGLGLVLRHLRRPRGLHRLRWERRGPPPPLPPAGDASTPLAAAAAAIDDALERDADARSIIECWTALERSLADLGFPRHAAETSTAYVERVLAAYGIAPEPPRRLGALYREARFSRHELPASARESAQEALRALRDGLRAVPRAT